MKTLIIAIVLLTASSCWTNSSDELGQTDSSKIHPDNFGVTGVLSDTAKIKTWLTKVILDYVSADDLKQADEQIKSVMTTDYYNCKLDAINLEYSDMTESEFKQKWHDKFDTKFIGRGGFFISAQDNGPIEIPVCILLKSSDDNSKFFQVVIHDKQWNTNYVRDIKIISKENRLLIADIIEYN
jgi:hypothetical protein